MRDTFIEDYGYENEQKTKRCIRCEAEFPFRSNKKFCSPNCRKRHSEVKQNSYSSPRKHRNNTELFDSAARIAEMYFMLPITERDGFMADLIRSARSGENKRMRDILSNKVLLDTTNNWGNPLKGRRGRSYGSIAQAAKSYCRRYWDASVKDVVYGRAPEPWDGVVE